MGIYTRFQIAVALKPDTPREVTGVIRFLCRDIEFPTTIPNHPFFLSPRWNGVGSCSSAYHDWIAAARVGVAEHDEKSLWFTLICDIKDYGGETDLFCEWIAPYVETTGFAGYKRYEEDDFPSLLWFRAGRPVWVFPSF